MVKTISGNLIKSIAAQDLLNNFSAYIFNFSIQPTKNFVVNVLLNNENNDICDGFYVANGRLFNTNDDKFLYGINNGQEYKVTLVLSGNDTNFYINDNFVSKNKNLYNPRQQIRGVTVEMDTGCLLNLDLSVSGQLPEYSFSNFNFSGENISGVGYINNQNSILPFRIYSGVEESGLFNFTNNFNDVTGTSSFNIKRNYELQTQDELSDNISSYNFTIYSNFGIFDTSIPIETVFPVVQNLDSSPLLNFSGVGTGLGTFLWSNYKGQKSYEPPLQNKIVARYISGNTGTTGFDSIFSFQYSSLDSGNPYESFIYNPSITGYEYIFDTYQNSGLQYKISRNLTGYSIGINIDYSGYNTGINYLITGF